MAETAIGWTDASWNPVTGCSKVSAGCDHCYAETMTAMRAGQSGWIEEHRPWTPENAEHNVRLRPERLEQPLSNRKPWNRPHVLVFVNSMSDLFHPRVPGEFIAQVFDVMEQSRHTFQVLTKRPKRMRDWCRRYRPQPLANVWLGTSIEDRDQVDRADMLREVPAAVRFISAEPLIGPLVLTDIPEDDPRYEDPCSCSAGCSQPSYYAFNGLRSYAVGHAPPDLDLTDIDWLIVGGESGKDHRPIKAEWVRDLRDACESLGVAFFMKQWGGWTPKSGGRELDGRTYDEYPQRPVPALGQGVLL